MQRDITHAVGGSLLGLIGGLVMGAVSAVAVAQTDGTDAVDANEELFKKGMQALEDDRLKSAIEAFHSILSDQPSLHRARLELAVAYYRAFRYDEAQRLAQEVLDDPTTPPEVRVTILAFLAQLKQDQQSFAVRHHVEPSISLGYMYDSNVNVGPASDVVQIGDQTLTLVEGSERSDSAVVLGAGVTHRYQPGKTFEVGERTALFLWQSDLGLYHREYDTEGEFNLSVLSASTGPAWVVLRHWRANVAVRAEYIWLGNAKLALFTSLNPAVTWQFKDGELTWDATVTDRNYADDRPVAEGGDAGREGTYWATGPSLGHYFMQRKLAAQVGVRAVQFRADDDRFGYDGYDAFAGANLKAWTGGSLFARLSYRDLDYDGVEPIPGVARDETERRVSIGFQHEFRDGYLNKWALSGGLQYTKNESNISIYDYDRRQFMLNLGKTF